MNKIILAILTGCLPATAAVAQQKTEARDPKPSVEAARQAQPGTQLSARPLAAPKQAPAAPASGVTKASVNKPESGPASAKK